MIQSIELKNFKSIKQKYFPLRKLNILMGLNGMGKSSFVQSLLLLRQSDRIEHGELKLQAGSNGYVNIGTTKDALYQYSKKDENLSITFQFAGKEAYQMEFGYEIEADVFKQKNLQTDVYGENKSKIDKSESLFSNNFQYLNANRVPPQSNHPKNYSAVVTNKNLGSYGEFTAHFIETYYNDDVAFDSIIHPDSTIKDEVLGTEIINKTLINQINLWMGAISPGVNIKTTTISSEEVLLEYTFKQPNFGNTNRFKPENVGFGISYALHVVTALLSAREGELVIIENPESHIHPKGQAELGKLIALVAQNDVQLIIETHSDHIINGIRVAVKETPVLSKETILFFFDKVVTEREQYSKIDNIEIDVNGELSDYPEHMMDEWSNQLLKLL
jgi:predicted ATPase